MLILMCSDPFDTRRVDDEWAAERAVAREQGHEVALIHWESIVAGDPHAATRRVALRSEPEQALYRGWMVSPAQYRALFDALRERGVVLINSPERYRWAHTLPGWYASVEGLTPRSVSVEVSAGDDLGGALAAARSLLATCAGGLIVKDYVKSRKHEWHEACFIPDADALESVVRTFVERQGEIEGGLVFREYVQLRSLGPHPKSGMPMSIELRMFWRDGEELARMPYWPEQRERQQEFIDSSRDPELAATLAQLREGFITVDLALTEAGRWIIMEIGDGQVSGLPSPGDAESLYRGLGTPKAVD